MARIGTMTTAIASRKAFDNGFEQESDFSVLQLSQSLPALSSSRNSNGSVCPSLTTSNTFSSEGLAELETDAMTPLQSPMLYRAYDVAFRTLADPSEVLQFDDGLKNATPQAMRAERKSYFPLVGKTPRKQCEAGMDYRGAAKTGQKNGPKSIRSGRPSVLERGNQAGSAEVDSRDDELTLDIGNHREPPDGLIRSASPQRWAKTDAILSNVQYASSAGILSPGTDQQESQMMERCIGPRLEPSPTWHGKCVLPTEVRPFERITPALHKLQNTVDQDLGGDHEPRSPEKVGLRPLDTVLSFVQTPSPMDELPPI